jgi:hypothetical protein
MDQLAGRKLAHSECGGLDQKPQKLLDQAAAAFHKKQEDDRKACHPHGAATMQPATETRTTGRVRLK